MVAQRDHDLGRGRTRVSGQTTLITGASSGIGRALAGLFAADGYDLVLVARREPTLRQVARELQDAHGVRIDVEPADLSDPNTPEAIKGRLDAKGIPVDILVNGAGFGARGATANLDFRPQLDMIAVNVMALTALTRLLLPGMLERDRGGVLNVGSTAAFQPGPLMAVYYATKAYVQSFTEALAEEVRGTRLHVTCLAPGPTNTAFAERAGMRGTRLFGLGTLPSSVVASVGFRAWRRGTVLVVPGLANKTAAQAVRFLPRWSLRRIIRSLNSRGGSESPLR